eukprot:GCRY01004977.1.p1 GENE.GCRY01004977.1~~GCRY01004977.1.p1  ORF type:complete len:266 (-),score=49.17 GCRY01004977.1:375-1172(-)
MAGHGALPEGAFDDIQDYIPFVKNASEWYRNKTGKHLPMLGANNPVPDDDEKKYSAVIQQRPLRSTDKTIYYTGREVEKMLLQSQVRRTVNITIPLKGGTGAHASITKETVQAIRRIYAEKYLQRLGALPTPENIQKVLKEIPIKRSDIHEYYRSQGCLSDYLRVDPTPPSLRRVWRGETETAIHQPADYLLHNTALKSIEDRVGIDHPADDTLPVLQQPPTPATATDAHSQDNPFTYPRTQQPPHGIGRFLGGGGKGDRVFCIR